MDMNTINDFIWPFTIWHWIILALFLFAIEMALGTFDLLMIGIAALVAAMWTAFAPEALSEWEIQLGVFSAAAVGLIILGRTLFSQIRIGGPGEPKLNRRMARMIGARGVVVSAFQSGAGRVRIGDSEWMAESVGGVDLPDGTQIVVDGSKSTVVLVKAAI
ncbi:MAG: NfeD family protein [Pseudomonadota bacterium]